MRALYYFAAWIVANGKTESKVRPVNWVRARRMKKNWS